MAPPRKLPAIDTAVGFKTTTVRLQNMQFEEVDLFARAVGLSMTEFTRKALEHYIKHLAHDDEVQKAVRKQINRTTRMLDRIAARANNADGEAEDEEE